MKCHRYLDLKPRFAISWNYVWIFNIVFSKEISPLPCDVTVETAACYYGRDEVASLSQGMT